MMPSGFTRLEEDARRIVAAVNAVAGFSSELRDAVANGRFTISISRRDEDT